ncbi:MAG: AMP-binding protein, partial [Coleofasciculaceae cyanobacterium]
MTQTELQLLNQWNYTTSDYPSDQCIHQLFESQVKLNPDKIAITFEDNCLTYQELNQQANQLSHYLHRQVGTETLVGICTTRSLLMVVGLLAILKAGCAYVPLDPAYPQERLAFMIEDAQLSVILTESDLVSALPVCAEVICIDDTAMALCPKTNPNTAVTPQNLAYTIYTSGSTGKPKGVQITHQAVVNFLTSMSHTPGMCAQDISLAITTICFDIAALELYLPLSVGASIVIVSQKVALDASQLIKIIA